MIDTHVHLNYDPLDKDISGVLERSRAAGVDRWVIPGTDWDTSTSGIELANQHTGVYAAVGVHPSDAHLYGDEQREIIHTLLTGEPHPIAIGEVGLDYYHTTDHVPAQKVVFSEMIGLAKIHSLPLIIHTRDCFVDAYDILSREAKDIPTVIHCFSGTNEEAQKWLDLGFLVSFTGMITYKKNDALREIVKNTPIDRMMIETDGPFLAPEGFRGQPCEPRFSRNVAECIAEVKGMTVEEVDQITTATAESFFKL